MVAEVKVGLSGDQINNEEIRGWERGGSLGPFGSSQILTAPSSPYLHMVGSQDNPATEAIAQVDDSHTAAETHDTGQCHTQRGNQDLQRGNGTNSEGNGHNPTSSQMAGRTSPM